MGLYADLIAAEAEVDRLKAELDTARANRDAIKARLVLEGPDVSQFQGAIDWSLVDAGFVFHRTSDGDIRDTSWQESRVAEIGVPLAPYHFGRVASDGNRQRNGKSEAAMAVYFAESMGWGRPGDLPLAYDFETLNGQTPAKAAVHVDEFCAAYKYLKGHHPILYTNPATWAQVASEFSGAASARLALSPLWVAHWGVAEPDVPAPWTDWAFWQYTNVGSLPGITGNVDLNRFNGTKAALDALRI